MECKKVRVVINDSTEYTGTLFTGKIIKTGNSCVFLEVKPTLSEKAGIAVSTALSQPMDLAAVIAVAAIKAVTNNRTRTSSPLGTNISRNIEDATKQVWVLDLSEIVSSELYGTYYEIEYYDQEDHYTTCSLYFPTEAKAMAWKDILEA